MFSWKIQKSFYSSLTPKEIWPIWSDLDKWPLFDKEVKEAKLLGPLAKGEKGYLILKNDQKIDFTLVEVEKEHRFKDSSKLPFTSLTFDHLIMPNSPKGCTLIQTVECKGLLAPLLRFTLYKTMQREIPQVLHQLEILAKEAQNA